MSLNQRRLFLPEMEGAMARWYDKQRGTPDQIIAYRKQASLLTASLPDGAQVLEVAPGPGYLAIEMARLGRLTVSGLDISRTFVDIEQENARKAGVTVDFRHGDVAAMPFAAASFDLVVCQAAFKNFRQPVSALNEMHRVLREGGVAVIQDMRKEASNREIAREVSQQGLRGINGWITLLILRRLRRRAYAQDRLARVVRESAFTSADVHTDGIGFEARLRRGAGQRGNP